jgi:hypothetical protein
MLNLQSTDGVTLINSKIEDGYLIAGLTILPSFTHSPVDVTDLDSGTTYKIELDDELTNQPFCASFANEYFPLLSISHD